MLPRPPPRGLKPPKGFVLNPRQHEAIGLIAGPATHVMLFGGSRSGKTFVNLSSIVIRAVKAPGSTHVILRHRFNHLKASVIFDTLPRLMKLRFPDLEWSINKTDWFAELRGGSRLHFGGLDEKDRTEKILGQEHSTIFLNECSQISYDARNKAVTRLAQNSGLKLKALYDCNPPSMAHWTARMFIRHQEPKSGAALENPERYVALRMNPDDNLRNLPPEYVAELEALPDRDKRRFRFGEFLAQVDNALWTADRLDELRIARPQLPEMTRIVVAIDPSGCEGPEDTRSDEIGIVACGIDRAGRGYVLEDVSGHFSPEKWARAALTLYDRWGADRLVAERNFGGAMVESTIRAVRRDASVKLVTASKGKTQRAEPVAALYEQGRVRHLGVHPDLEDQLGYFSTAGYQGEKSPDRADACLAEGTKVLTARGQVTIEHVTVTDRVLTRAGWRQVLRAEQTSSAARLSRVALSDGSSVLATAEHPFWVVGLGFRRLDELIWGNILLAPTTALEDHPCQSLHPSSSSSMVASTAATQQAGTDTCGSTTSASATTDSEPTTAISTRSSTARSPKGGTSTTPTKTPLTTTPATSNACPPPSTPLAIAQDGSGVSGISLPPSPTSLPRGMGRKKDAPGTASTPAGPGRGASASMPAHAPTLAAPTGSSPSSPAPRGEKEVGASAPPSATVPSSTPSIAIRSSSPVPPAGSPSTCDAGASAPRPVPVSVVGISAESVGPVWNLMIEGQPEFFANGVLVHNCIWGLTELMIAKRETVFVA